MIKLKIFICSIVILSTSLTYSQTNSYFDKGSRELGISNIGIGYSSLDGFLVQATTRYQYYVLNRVALGATAFYNKYSSSEWMGLGPVGSYIFLTHQNFFARFDQHLITAKYNGFTEDLSTFYGTSAVSINYLANENISVGLGYAHSYAVNDGEVFRPNIIQVFVGWFWN